MYPSFTESKDEIIIPFSACTQERRVKSPNYIKYPLLHLVFSAIGIAHFRSSFFFFHNTHASVTEAGVTNSRWLSSPAVPRVRNTVWVSEKVVRLLLRFWRRQKTLLCMQDGVSEQ